MSIRKFEQNDVFVSVLKTKPHTKFSIFNGEINYRADFANTVEKGYAAISDLNLNAPAADTGPVIVYEGSLDFSQETNSQYLPLI
jgi:hypothetical protein